MKIRFLLGIVLTCSAWCGCVIGPFGFQPDAEPREKGVILLEKGVDLGPLREICALEPSKMVSSSAILNDTIRRVVDTSKAAVVNIYVKTSTPVRAHILFFPVPGLPAVHLPGEALGSGFFCSEAGFILSNAHVVSRARTLSAKTAEGKIYDLDVIAFDRQADLALLRTQVRGKFPYVPLRDTKDLSEGDWVIAIGNPLGLNHSVSHGIVSQKSRSLGEFAASYKDFPSFIQSDTPINPGNSGGPLLDITGRVVGINTAVIQGAQGISFTVPSERIEVFLKEVMQKSN